MVQKTHDVDECKNIFITWQWMIGIVLSIVIAIISIAYSAGAKISKNESSYQSLIEDNSIIKQRVDIIEIRSRCDMDTIKLLLRAKR